MAILTSHFNSFVLFFYSSREADLFIASICNQKGGIAVADDSDFFLFDIKNGVITLTDLLESIKYNKNKTSIYRCQHLVNHLKIEAPFLPYLALVLGMLQYEQFFACLLKFSSK